MVSYLFLSCLSGLVEFGSGMLLLVNGFPLWLVVLAGAAYQTGNIIPVINNRIMRTGILLFACVTGIFTAITHGIASAVFIILYASSLSIGVQSVRSAFKSDYQKDLKKNRRFSKHGTAIKRSFRILGFLLSFLPAVSAVTLPICAVLSGYFSLKCGNCASDVSNNQALPRLIGYSMFFHQMHYFVYTYIMPFIVCKMLIVLGLQDILSVFLTSVLLAFSWCVYTFPGYLVKEKGYNNYRGMFFGCHSFLVIIMLALAWAIKNHQFALILTTWLLTGLGGGSVGCIKEIPSVTGDFNLKFAEDLGHIVGSVLSLLLCIVYGVEGAYIMTVFSAVFAFAAMAFALLEIIKEFMKEESI